MNLVISGTKNIITGCGRTSLFEGASSSRECDGHSLKGRHVLLGVTSMLFTSVLGFLGHLLGEEASQLAHNGIPSILVEGPLLSASGTMDKL